MALILLTRGRTPLVKTSRSLKKTSSGKTSTRRLCVHVNEEGSRTIPFVVSGDPAVTSGPTTLTGYRLVTDWLCVEEKRLKYQWVKVLIQTR